MSVMSARLLVGFAESYAVRMCISSGPASAVERLGHRGRGYLVGPQAGRLIVDVRHDHQLVGLRALHELAHLRGHGTRRADERDARPPKRIAGIAQVALPLL